jgi:DNA-binding MarR family transcriptional regulator
MASIPGQSDIRAQLLERYLAAQPELQRRFSVAMPEELRAELGGITMHQLGALHAIAHHAIATRGALTMRQFAACLHASSLSTATQMADRLIKLGLVHRTHDPDDRRVVRLALTARAKQLFDHLIDVRRQVLADAFAALDDEELATLVQLLERAISPTAAHEEIA